MAEKQNKEVVIVLKVTKTYKQELLDAYAKHISTNSFILFSEFTRRHLLNSVRNSHV